MPLSIKDPTTEELARELARETGESITGSIATALRERLARVRQAKRKRSLADEVHDLSARYRAYPVADPRTPDELLGYDEHGLPR
ncbi:MAG: type II toxin-antitoxin system VapB family antitoxin [Myxococcota bacterium]|nr:type II toxin-antitoxin system VapB family antitoxin [Myxococcota bacterium]